MVEVSYPSPNGAENSPPTTTPASSPQLRFDTSYFRTIPGILKCVQIGLNLLGFISIEASGLYAYHSRGVWFNTVAMTGLWFTAILLVCYLFHIVEKLHRIPWNCTEFIFCAIWTCFYLIASCLAATFGVEAFAAAAFFGFCGMVAYAMDAFLKFIAWKRGAPAQGNLGVEKTTTTTTTTVTY